MLLIYTSFSHFNLLLATKIKAFIKSPDFCNRACMYFKGLYSLKSFTMGFWYFCPKNGSKRPINGPKISWFGMVWFGLARLGQYKMV